MIQGLSYEFETISGDVVFEVKGDPVTLQGQLLCGQQKRRHEILAIQDSPDPDAALETPRKVRKISASVAVVEKPLVERTVRPVPAVEPSESGADFAESSDEEQVSK